MLFGPETWLINCDSKKMDQKFTANRKLPTGTTIAQPLPWRLYCWSLWEQNTLCSHEAMTSQPQQHYKVQHQGKNHHNSSSRDVAWHQEVGSSVTSLTETEARQPSAQVCVLSVICKEKSEAFLNPWSRHPPPIPNKNNRRSEWDDLIPPYKQHEFMLSFPVLTHKNSYRGKGKMLPSHSGN